MMGSFIVITDQADADRTVEADTMDAVGHWLVFRLGGGIVAAYSSEHTVAAVRAT